MTLPQSHRHLEDGSSAPPPARTQPIAARAVGGTKKRYAAAGSLTFSQPNLPQKLIHREPSQCKD